HAQARERAEQPAGSRARGGAGEDAGERAASDGRTDPGQGSRHDPEPPETAHPQARRRAASGSLAGLGFLVVVLRTLREILVVLGGDPDVVLLEALSPQLVHRRLGVATVLEYADRDRSRVLAHPAPPVHLKDGRRTDGPPGEECGGRKERTGRAARRAGIVTPSARGRFARLHAVLPIPLRRLDDASIQRRATWSHDPREPGRHRRGRVWLG